MTVEVLVVDDLPGTAQEYARYIQTSTRIEAIGTDNPAQAIELVESNPIKIAVLDERMPEMSGTQLYQRLKEINPLLKTIMLTGQAEAMEVGAAFKQGYDDYLHKSQLEQLPATIETLYAKYFVDASLERANQTFFPLNTQRRWSFPHRLWTKITYALIDYQVLDSTFVFPGSWLTTQEVVAGGEVQNVNSIAATTTLVTESSTTAHVRSRFGLSDPHFRALTVGIEHALDTQLSQSLTDSITYSRQETRKLTLPPQPSLPTQPYVKARHYQKAQVYRKVRCIVLASCQACNRIETFSLLVYQPVRLHALRQVDYWSDGREPESTPTGFEPY